MRVWGNLRLEARVEIHFWFDVACPWVALAAGRVVTLAEETGAVVRFCPVDQGHLFARAGFEGDPEAAFPERRRQMRRIDRLRCAERLGIALADRATPPRAGSRVMALIAGAPPDRRADMVALAVRRVWVDGDDPDAIVDEVAAAGRVDPGLADDPASRDALIASTEEALKHEVFGVPSFTVGGRTWFGSDRLDRVADAVRGACTPVFRRAPAGGEGRSLSFFHDFSSPFSYLASTWVDAVAASAGTQAPWTPILVGALFRDVGTPMVPVATYPAAKQRWYLRDLEEQAERLGVPFRWPRHFPYRSITALRVSIAEPRAIAPLYRAGWADDRNIGDDAVLREVLAEAGLDGAVEAAQAPAVKAALINNGERALAVGACGVPSFLVDARVLIWGNDRREHVEAALAGWVPERG